MARACNQVLFGCVAYAVVFVAFWSWLGYSIAEGTRMTAPQTAEQHAKVTDWVRLSLITTDDVKANLHDSYQIRKPVKTSDRG